MSPPKPSREAPRGLLDRVSDLELGQATHTDQKAVLLALAALEERVTELEEFIHGPGGRRGVR